MNKNLNSQNQNQTQKRNKIIALCIALAALVGFSDATYLTVKFFSGDPVGCTLFNGCELVTTSIYSAVFGVPVALFGALYYLLILVCIAIYADRGSDSALRAAAHATWIGLAASAYFVSIQVFVLRAYCLYCLFSAFTSTTLFVLGRLVLLREKNATEFTADQTSQNELS
ncbi:MAG: Vitamin K epoxide reductase [uncultured bacterium]|nr:MAG: Vitamin K epoxide reductase [uncultured bacterium]